MKNMMKLLKQAQEMQTKMTDMQSKMDDVTAEGRSGGGLVQVHINGKREVTGVKIDPSLVNKDEVEILEDLLVAAIQDASKQIESKIQEQMSELTDGLNLPPGFQMPF